jgi:hypothetical protein
VDEKLHYLLIPTIDELIALYAKLQKIGPQPALYSDPGSEQSLPFPFLFDRIPEDRFRFTYTPVPTFEYMGRQRFSDLWHDIQSLGYPGGSQLYIQGTMGYGKSHILAALACLLHRNGSRVVYLPDCRQMLTDPLPYFQSALLCTFSDPTLSSKRDEIRRLTSLDDVLGFCRRLGKLRVHFIVDQINALESEGENQDNQPNGGKAALSVFLQKLYIGHNSITSASANYRTALHMEQKQTGEKKMRLMGGMSEVSLSRF